MTPEELDALHAEMSERIITFGRKWMPVGDRALKLSFIAELHELLCDEIEVVTGFDTTMVKVAIGETVAARLAS